MESKITEGENEDDTDIHVHYFLLPISFILNFGFSTNNKNALPSLSINDHKYSSHCPIFIYTRQILI